MFRYKKTASFIPSLILCITITLLLPFMLVLSCNKVFPHGTKGLLMKELKILFPNAASFVTKAIPLNEKEQQSIKNPIAYIAVSDGKSLGAAWFTHAKLSKEEINLGVAITPQGKILKIALYDLKDTPLTDPVFLSQFTGKDYRAKARNVCFRKQW